jgi:hypothetical protein
MRRRSEELHAYSLSFIRGIAKIHDARLLLFLREWIVKDEDGVEGKRLVQVEQTAMSADHNGFTGFAEAPVVGVLSGDDNAHAHKNPGAAANLVIRRFGHGNSMLKEISACVNEAVFVMFPPCNNPFE